MERLLIAFAVELALGACASSRVLPLAVDAGEGEADAQEGSCWGQAREQCDTPSDDDCDGLVNDGCRAIGYRMSRAPECGVWCYFDELHNIQINGPAGASDNTGHDLVAPGQLIDATQGADAWDIDMGNGIAAEWVGWLQGTIVLIFEFSTAREFRGVSLGLNNAGNGAVVAPQVMSISLSDDGFAFSPPLVFREIDGNIEPVPPGHRGEVVLNLGTTGSGRFVRIELVNEQSWTFVDEVGFDPEITDQLPPVE